MKINIKIVTLFILIGLSSAIYNCINYTNGCIKILFYFNFIIIYFNY